MIDFESGLFWTCVIEKQDKITGKKKMWNPFTSKSIRLVNYEKSKKYRVNVMLRGRVVRKTISANSGLVTMTTPMLWLELTQD